MTSWIIVLLAVIGIYVFFFLAPSIVMFLVSFGRRTGHSYDDRDYSGTCYEPCMPVAIPAMKRMRERPSRICEITRNGAVLRADLYHCDGDASGKVAILCHGYNATPLMNFAVPAEELLKLGFDVLLINERANGKSGGRFGGMGLLESADIGGWVDHAAKELEAKEILLWGMSMGATAVAFESCELDPDLVKGLILDCGFSCPREAVIREAKKRHLPWPILYPPIELLAHLVLKVNLGRRASESLKKCRIPALFLHGGADEAVPVGDSRENYGACASEKEFCLVPGVGHTCSFILGGEELRGTFRRFLDRNF